MSDELIDPEAGYGVVPLLDRAMLDRLRAHFDSLAVAADVERFVSVADLTIERARAVDRWLQEQLGMLVRQLLPEFEPFLATYYGKGARRGTRVEFHQDWTYTDERRHRAVLIWIPLVDVDASNGAMEVVPGSHLWSDGIRASNDRGVLPTDPFGEQLRERSVLLEMCAGDALMFDPGLVHATPPNRSDAQRPVAGIGMAPADAQIVHFTFDPHGEMIGYELERDAFYAGPYRGLTEASTRIDPWTSRPSAEDFRSRL